MGRLGVFRAGAALLALITVDLLAGSAIAQEDFHGARLVASRLQPLKYNHPGLIVDLGVGLWAWPLPMDYDQDGDYDLVVVCPDKPYNGAYFFENTQGKVKRPIFKAGRKISKGLQNAQISCGTDGKGLVTTPGSYYPEFLNSGFGKPKQFPLPRNIHDGRVRANQWKVADLDADGRDDLIIGVGDWRAYGWDNAFNSLGRWTRGPLHGYVYWARNISDDDGVKYAEPEKVVAGDQPIDVYGMPSPCLADFDGDGDLDLVCGEFLDGLTYFENVGDKRQPKFRAGRRLLSEDGPLRMDLQMITPTAVDWDGDGDPDLIVGDEDGRVALVEHTGRVRDNAPLFRKPAYFQQEAEDVKFGALATPVAFDWDDDGDEDLLTGNSAGYIGLIENLGIQGENETPTWAAPVYLTAAGEVIRYQAGKNGSVQGPCEAKWGYTTFSVADWDHDGRPDIVLNSILGRIMWHRNIGAMKAPALDRARPVTVPWPLKPPKPEWTWWNPEPEHLVTQWRTTPAVTDWNGDGLNDLVMLDHEGYLALYLRERNRSGLRLMPGKRVLMNQDNFPQRFNAKTAGKSGRRKLCVVDWDRDGRLDIIANAKSAEWFRQLDPKDSGRYVLKRIGPLGDRELAGHTTSPTTVDFDGDGKRELLLGAEDGRFYYLPAER